MARAAKVVAIRKLGLSLAQIGRVLQGDNDGLASVLATHQEALEKRIRGLVDTAEIVGNLRADLAQGTTPSVTSLEKLTLLSPKIHISFDLPWPWGGEEFALSDI